MTLRPLAVCAALCASVLMDAAMAATWRAVPGAPELDMDIASLQADRSRVDVWLRWRGRSPLVTETATFAARSPRIHRTSVLVEFDCARRVLRTLAASAHDAAGRPVYMSSVPGEPAQIREEDLAWAYDAACEAARAPSARSE
ncbi:hypothetical protein [Ramlibacter sp.]|uniref:hypothetical protein n=1 Tax=Ramlibacter sp. TaxID=1917967 RepID=UPI003D0F9E2E